MPRSILKTHREFSANTKLNNILENRTEGASAIENATFEFIDLVLKDHRMSSLGRLKKSLQKIRIRFSQMANIVHLTEYAMKHLSRCDAETFAILMNDYRRQIDENRAATIITASRQIRKYKSIFTLSNSTIIRQAILAAKKAGWRGDVRIVESRPKNEGTLLTYRLVKAGIRAFLTIDSTIPHQIKQADAVFLGADAVTTSYFVNKIGSQIAVDYAARLRKPVYVAADKAKFISGSIYKFSPDENPPSEISSRKSRNLKISNSYFEVIKPAGRFKYICGTEVFGANRVKYFLKCRV